MRPWLRSSARRRRRGRPIPSTAVLWDLMVDGHGPASSGAVATARMEPGQVNQAGGPSSRNGGGQQLVCRADGTWVESYPQQARAFIEGVSGGGLYPAHAFAWTRTALVEAAPGGNTFDGIQYPPIRMGVTWNGAAGYGTLNIVKENGSDWWRFDEGGWFHGAIALRAGNPASVGLVGKAIIEGPGGVRGEVSVTLTDDWQWFFPSVQLASSGLPAAGNIALTCGFEVAEATITAIGAGTPLAVDTWDVGYKYGRPLAGLYDQAYYTSFRKASGNYGDVIPGALGMQSHSRQCQYTRWSDDLSNAAWTKSGGFVRAASAVAAPDNALNGNTYEDITVGAAGYIEQAGITFLSSTGVNLSGLDGGATQHEHAVWMAFYVKQKGANALPANVTCRIVNSVSAGSYSAGAVYVPQIGAYLARVGPVSSAETTGTWTARWTFGTAATFYATRFSAWREGYDSHNHDEVGHPQIIVPPRTRGYIREIAPSQAWIAPQHAAYTPRKGTVLLRLSTTFDPASYAPFRDTRAAFAINDCELNGSANGGLTFYCYGSQNNVNSGGKAFLSAAMTPRTAAQGGSDPDNGYGWVFRLSLDAGMLSAWEQHDIELTWDMDANPSDPVVSFKIDGVEYAAHANVWEHSGGGSVDWQLRGRAYPVLDRDDRLGGAILAVYIAAPYAMPALERTAKLAARGSRQKLVDEGLPVAA